MRCEGGSALNLSSESLPEVRRYVGKHADRVVAPFSTKSLWSRRPPLLRRWRTLSLPPATPEDRKLAHRACSCAGRYTLSAASSFPDATCHAADGRCYQIARGNLHAVRLCHCGSGRTSCPSVGLASITFAPYRAHLSRRYLHQPDNGRPAVKQKDAEGYRY